MGQLRIGNVCDRVARAARASPSYALELGGLREVHEVFGPVALGEDDAAVGGRGGTGGGRRHGRENGKIGGWGSLGEGADGVASGNPPATSFPFSLHSHAWRFLSSHTLTPRCGRLPNGLAWLLLCMTPLAF